MVITPPTVTSRHHKVEPLRSTAPGENIDNSSAFGRRVIGARHKEGLAVLAKHIVCWQAVASEVAKNLPGALVIGMRGKAQITGIRFSRLYELARTGGRIALNVSCCRPDNLWSYSAGDSTS